MIRIYYYNVAAFILLQLNPQRLIGPQLDILGTRAAPISRAVFTRSQPREAANTVGLFIAI